jgi:hypothetical protein
MPRTTYRFKVAPLLLSKTKQTETLGEWSEPESIMTLDQQSVDPSSCGNHAILINNKLGVSFDRPGIVVAYNGYTFGKHYWSICIDQ